MNKNGKHKQNEQQINIENTCNLTKLKRQVYKQLQFENMKHKKNKAVKSIIERLSAKNTITKHNTQITTTKKHKTIQAHQNIQES